MYVALRGAAQRAVLLTESPEPLMAVRDIGGYF